jgi:hypothetical protein
MLYPATTEVLAIQVNITEWETVCCVPTPDNEIAAGEFVALLATVTLPDKLPAATGENVASNFAD